MINRCEPPEELRQIRDHWCSPTGTWDYAEPMRYLGGVGWRCIGVVETIPIDGGRRNWSYLGPIPDHAALARLMKAAAELFDNEAVSAETGAAEFHQADIDELRAALDGMKGHTP